MTEADRARLKSKVANLKSQLNAAVESVEDFRADVRSVEGDHDSLVFWPLTRPTADRQATDYSAWLARVDAILGA
jgi:hypothetical protein